jgi:hypothetical protein
VQLGGFTLDSNGNAYAVRIYAAASGDDTASFIVQYNNSLSTDHALTIADTTYTYTFVSDIVADASGKVYTGAECTNSSRLNTGAYLCKYSGSSFTAPVWASFNALPMNFSGVESMGVLRSIALHA